MRSRLPAAASRTTLSRPRQPKEAQLNADGRYVVFNSFSTNLHPDATNFRTHVYLHDRVTGVTALESVRAPHPQLATPASKPFSRGDASSYVWRRWKRFGARGRARRRYSRWFS